MSRDRLEAIRRHSERQQEVNREINERAGQEYTPDPLLSQLSDKTLERIVDSHPLADERVEGMDVSHHNGEIPASDSAEYVGHFYVNNKRYELHKETEGELAGTTFTQPRYDQRALETMYGPDYFGDKATLQVGIPDRGADEVKRRQDISTLQVNEWEAAGIKVKDARVLEIGGGSGYLSQEVKKRGGNPTNVELCEERAEYCRSQGVDAYHGMLSNALEDGAIKPGSVDIVACYDLLEHIVDPDVFIKDVQTVLKEGGCMTIRIPETPAEGPSLHLVDHVNHFTRDSLKHFMARNGFEMVERPGSAQGGDPYYSGTFSEKLDVKEGSKLQPRTIENMTVFFQKKSPSAVNKFSLMGACRKQAKENVDNNAAVEVTRKGAVLGA